MAEPTPAKRILVVDDEEDVRNLVCRVLKDEGYEVDAAVDGTHAIEKLHQSRPDLMILDLMMPGVDGWSVLKSLHGHPDPPPVVVLTARTDYATFTRGVREGATGFVCKPFRLQELVVNCQRVLLARARMTEPPMEGERRREPRRTLTVVVNVLFNETSPTVLGELVNISPSGAQVDLEGPLKPGDLLQVAFHIPGGGIPLNLKCQVQWWRGSASRGVAHGLRFLNLTPETERHLKELVQPPPSGTPQPA